MNLDQELHHALRRKQAPVDLADRVLARIAAEAPAQRAPRFGSGRVMQWLAAAAAVVLMAGAAERYHVQQQHAAEAARVQEEIRIALQITNEKLALVQQKMQRPADDGGR